MDPFQVSPFATSQPSKPPLLPQDALMVVDNRQLQVWSGINCWPPHPQDPQRHGAAATLVGLTASSAETPSTSASTSPVTEKKKKRVFKKRKATHTVRKEQKAALAKEIEQLQAQLDEIKFQALVQQGQASRSYHDRVVENAVLRESIQDQHLAMAQVRALLSTHTQHHMSGVRPMETKICLSADRAERRGVLHALRETKLRDAKRFLRARSNGINTNTPYFQEERYETAEGDYCIVRFEVSPLRGVKGGVRAVYDAVLQAAFNAEIIISETSGNITVREDDDQNDDSVSQMRLVSQTTRGVLLENNLVHFAEYSCGESDKGCYAVTTTDFVDEDDLYPYRPLERVRRDATAAMLITSYVESTAKGESELVVAVTRWSCARICHTDLNVSREAMLDIQQSAILSQGTFLNCVRETLGLPATTT
ncbi:uncharacterized protein KRP23_14041 [Phytophthora ramorum]|uniref:uncharacterized protein n=1 Tax=Phytophthora ramorum TaxID=164328 RepID=UPI00309F131D|nr:hypothetical protein KRP23_14000 [Phytophthora ramorum]KAH7462181.1 hypothetical protein KRP23_14041 [Phytophthora ramorum]